MNGIIDRSESFFEKLRDTVKEYVDEKRFSHILSVEKKAVEIGGVYAPAKIDLLRTAAILHDLTKCFSDEKQISVCEKYGYPLDETVSRQIFHTITAPLVIANELSLTFPGLDDPELLGVVRWHATGHAGMTLTESIIYLADYIEDTREYEDCKRLRDYYGSGLSDDMHYNYLHLYKTMLISFGYTIDDLISSDRFIDLNTIDARNYFLRLISEPEKGYISNEE